MDKHIVTEDYIVRATAAGGTLRAMAAITTNMVAEAKKLHNLSPVASAAMGRTMSAAALMSALLEGARDTVTIQVKGDGPLGGIVAVSDSNANVKGYINNPQVYLPLNREGKLDVSGAVGKNGYLNVIRDLGLKEPYIGYVDLVSGEIGEDIAYYYAFSEQIPSVVALGVLVDVDESILNSGGYIIQLMPGAEDDIISSIENKIKSQKSVTEYFSTGGSPESLLSDILGGLDLKITNKTHCRYFCSCSRDRMERNILSLGREEIMKLIKEQRDVETQCYFCNRKYGFSGEELTGLLNGQQ